MLGIALSSVALPQEAPRAAREFRGAWVATVDNIDWPSKPGLSVDQLKKEMTVILDLSEKIGLNALIFQVRPSADALYASPYEPWSWFLTGEQGKAPEGGFDPLAWTVEEAHKRGLELHVWLNPYRALHPAQKGPVAPSHVSKTLPNGVKKYGTYLWMDPSDSKVQDHGYRVFMDLVESYDIDGIHIDDYFYPYPIRENNVEVPFPDDLSWAEALKSEPGLKRDDWRRRSVNRFVYQVYSGIKRRKPWVKFGISPFGIYRPGVPAGIKAGVDQYAQLYADAKLWLEAGWCDYFTPQLYWPIAQEPQSFPKLLDWWRTVNPKKRHLWPGQYTSRLNPTGGNWQPKEVFDQIRLVRKGDDSPGTIHFSFKAFQNNWNGVTDVIGNVYRDRALVPASPWLGKSIPASPLSVSVSGDDVTVSASGESVRFVAVYLLVEGKWKLAKVGAPGRLKVTGAGAAASVSATVLDRVMNESAATAAR